MNTLLVLHLCGTQEEMGAQHGDLLRAQGGWEGALEAYRNLPERLMLARYKHATDRTLAHLLHPALAVALRRLERARPAPYLARTRAFFESLGLPAAQTRTVGVMDAFQNVVGTLTRWGFVPFAQRTAAALPPACSSLVVWGRASEDGRLLHARNFDFPGIGVWDRWPTVVFCTPDDGLRYGFVATRGADVPGITAFNEAGLTVAMHSRFHRDVSFDGVMAVDLGHEIARNAESLDDAVRIARARRIASTWGLCVASARERRAVVLEVAASGVHVVPAVHGEDFVANTNRYFHPALRVDEVVPTAGFAEHCESRYQRLRAWAGRGGLGVGDLQRMLAEHGDAGSDGERAAGGVLAQPFTVKSVVVDPERRCIHVATGEVPASRGPWVEVPWTWNGTPGAEVVTPGAAPEPESRYARGTSGEAYRHYVEAVRLEQQVAPPSETEARIEAAVALDPEDPTYRFLAGAFCIRRGAFAEGLAHLEQGLGHERSPFHRGRMLLWAARAAEAGGDTERAQLLRRELLTIGHPLLAGHHAAAWREGTRPWSPARLRRIAVDVTLVDAG